MNKNLLPISIISFIILASCQPREYEQDPGTTDIQTIVVDSIVRDTIVQQDTVLVPQESPEAKNKTVMLSNTASERFYVGVDNIVRLKTIGVNADKVDLTALNPSTIIEKNKDKTFTVRFSKKGSTFLIANFTGGSEKFPIEVEKLPTPHVTLAGKYGGVMAANTLKSQKGLSARLDHIKDASFSISAYELIHYSDGAEVDRATNNEEIFNASMVRLINKAKAGDLYVFHKVQVLCPGDTESRPANGITVIVQ